MSHKGIWNLLLAWRPWAHAGARGQTERTPPERDELRRRHLERIVTEGMPVWCEEPEHCDRCHRELLLGERAVLMSREEDLLLACPLCVALLGDEGYRPVSLNPSARLAQSLTVPH